MDDAFGYWLAGFIDGEGCFVIQKNGNGARYCAFRLALHHRDKPILETIAVQTSLGKVWSKHSPSQHSPSAMWTVTRKAQCLDLVDLLEHYPLRAIKRNDFIIWAKAVRAWNRLSMEGHGNQHTGMKKLDYTEMDRLRLKLWEGRPHRGPKPTIA